MTNLVTFLTIQQYRSLQKDSWELKRRMLEGHGLKQQTSQEWEHCGRLFSDHVTHIITCKKASSAISQICSLF